MFAVNKKRIALGVCLLSLIIAGYLSLATLDGLSGNILRVFLGDSTIYAPGYSDEKFRAIKIGDTADAVLAQLGQPWMYIVKLEVEPQMPSQLFVFDELGKHKQILTKNKETQIPDLGEFRKKNRIHSEVWKYSKTDRDASFRERYFIIIQGRVAEKIASYYAD